MPTEQERYEKRKARITGILIGISGAVALACGLLILALAWPSLLGTITATIYMAGGATVITIGFWFYRGT